MSTLRNTLILLITLASINAWSDIKSKEAISREAKATHISADQLSGYLAGKDDFIFLDIRTEAEYQAGHIKGAKWFPRGNLEFYIQDFIKDPDAKIGLYCRSGGRSALSTLTMKSMGYSRLISMAVLRSGLPKATLFIICTASTRSYLIRRKNRHLF